MDTVEDFTMRPLEMIYFKIFMTGKKFYKLQAILYFKILTDHSTEGRQ